MLTCNRRKAETPELSQMLLAIVQSNPELAKSAPGALPPVKAPNGQTLDPIDPARRLSDVDGSPYILDVPVDMSALDLNGDAKQSEMTDDGEPYNFIPADPRSHYRAIVKEALSYDLAESHEDGVHGDVGSSHLLSKKSTELLHDIGLRWRLPYISRMLLLLDVVRERFVDQQLDLDTLDAAFNYVKELPQDSKKKTDLSLIHDRNKWTFADFTLNQQILKSIDDMLLRDLFEQFLHCYEAKPPNLGPIMYILETHIYEDPLYSRNPDDLDRFSDSLREALYEKAKDQYNFLRDSEIGQNVENVEFYHIIQLGKAVLKCAERIQKRYKKNPKIMGFVTGS